MLLWFWGVVVGYLDLMQCRDLCFVMRLLEYSVILKVRILATPGKEFILQWCRSIGVVGYILNSSLS